MRGMSMHPPVPNGCRGSSVRVDARKDVTEPPMRHRRGLR